MRAVGPSIRVTGRPLEEPVGVLLGRAAGGRGPGVDHPSGCGWDPGLGWGRRARLEAEPSSPRIRSFDGGARAARYRYGLCQEASGRLATPWAVGGGRRGAGPALPAPRAVMVGERGLLTGPDPVRRGLGVQEVPRAPGAGAEAASLEQRR